MLHHPTLDRLKALRLDGMVEAFAELQAQDRAAELSHAEWLGLLVDREEASRDTKRYESRLRTANYATWVPARRCRLRARRGLDRAVPGAVERQMDRGQA